MGLVAIYFNCVCYHCLVDSMTNPPPPPGQNPLDKTPRSIPRRKKTPMDNPPPPPPWTKPPGQNHPGQNPVIDCIKFINLDYMLHVRTLRDAFLADILMNLRKLILLFILCFKLTKT